MRRKKLRDYEHVESMAEVELVEGDCGDKAMAIASSLVDKALGTKAPTVAKVATTTNAKKPEVTVEPKVETPVKEVKEKKTKAKTPKATKEEVLAALRAYAEAKDSKEMAMAVIEDVTGVKKLGDVEAKHYNKLVKALAV